MRAKPSYDTSEDGVVDNKLLRALSVSVLSPRGGAVDAAVAADVPRNKEEQEEEEELFRRPANPLCTARRDREETLVEDVIAMACILDRLRLGRSSAS